VDGLVIYVVVARHTNQHIGSSIRERSEEAESKNEPSTLIQLRYSQKSTQKG